MPGQVLISLEQVELRLELVEVLLAARVSPEPVKRVPLPAVQAARVLP